MDSKSRIRRAALNSRIEKGKVFVDKKSRITAGGLACADSTHAINHVDSTLNWKILEWLSKGQARCRCLGRRVLTPSPWREFYPRDQSWVAQENPPTCAQNLRYTEGAVRRFMRVKLKRTSRARTEFTVIAIWLKKNWHISCRRVGECLSPLRSTAVSDRNSSLQQRMDNL